MKNILLFISLSIATYSLAQNEYNYQGNVWYYGNSVNQVINNVAATKNQTVEIKSTNVKNGKLKVYTKSYNEFAKLVDAYITKDGETYAAEKNNYDKNGELLNRKQFKKGKLSQESTYIRDEEGRVTSFKRKNSKGKLMTYNTWSYQTPGKKCYKNSTSYRRGGEKVKKYWEYEYYSECDKKKSTLKNGKGKVIKVWSYDCKKEGEEMTKKKDESQICKWEETDDNFLIKTYQSFDEKGKVRRTVTKYRLLDTAIVNYKHYNDKNELTYESSYNPDNKRILKSTNYKNGEERYTHTYQYDGDRMLAEEYRRKGKLRFKREYTYNADKKLKEYKYYGKDGELMWKSELAYK